MMLLALCAVVALSAVGCATGESPGGDAGSTRSDAGTLSDRLSAADLPEGFPSEVPVKSGEVVDSVGLPTGPTSTYVVSVVVTDTPEQLHEWWTAALEAADFEIVRQSFTGDATTGTGSIKAANTDGIVVIVVIRGQASGAAASLRATVPASE